MAEETLAGRYRTDRPQLPGDRTPVNRFDHIHSIIDAVFGPDDDSPVPSARTMVTPVDLTSCADCGTDMSGATFYLCGPCHQKSILEAI